MDLPNKKTTGGNGGGDHNRERTDRVTHNTTHDDDVHPALYRVNYGEKKT